MKLGNPVAIGKLHVFAEWNGKRIDVGTADIPVYVGLGPQDPEDGSHDIVLYGRDGRLIDESIQTKLTRMVESIKEEA